jgi:hypothetical protein
MFYSGGAPKKRAVLRILHHTKEEAVDEAVDAVDEAADADEKKRK